MTQKIYKTSRGKPVDIGALRLQNEHVRAVGNMNVNARGDRIDAQGRVIDSRGEQLERTVRRTSNVSNGPVHGSMPDADTAPAPTLDPDPLEDFDDVAANTAAPAEVAQPLATGPTPVEPVPVESAPEAPAEDTGGLAAAIARAKTVKQELEKTARQQAKEGPVRKI